MDSEYNFAATPTLYYDVLSSQSRSCQMLIKMFKICVNLQLTDSMADIDFNETYTWINSFCKLPTLVDGNVTLCNGHSILIYLCQKFAPLNSQNLCPCDYITRLKITHMLFYDGYILSPTLCHLLTDIFLVKYPNFKVEYHRSKVSNVYNSLNAFLCGHSYMIGNRMSIADICIVSTVSALNIIFPIDYEKFPKLFDWYQCLKKMEFYTCNDEGIQKMRYLLRNVGNFPFPSPFWNQSSNFQVPKMGFQSMCASNASVLSNRKEEHTVKPVVSRESNKSLLKACGLVAGNKNDTAKYEPDWVDKYCITVCQCNRGCCRVANKASNNQMHHFKKEDVKETIKIYKRLKPCKSSEVSFKIPEYHNPSPATAKIDKPKRVKIYNQHDNVSTENIKNFDLNECQVAKCYACQCHKMSSRSDKDGRERDTGKYNDNKHGSNTSKLKASKTSITTEPKTESESECETGKESELECKTDTGHHIIIPRHSEHKLTNQEVLDLLAKVRKLEKILELSDRALMNKNKILSNVSSTDSLTKAKTNVAHKCTSACSQTCNCGSQSPKEIEAKSSNTSSSRRTKLQQEPTRLAAGYNPKPFKSQFLKPSCPIASINLKQNAQISVHNLSRINEKIAKIIYHLSTKSTIKNKTNNRCDDCFKKGKVIKSKIPRLISTKYGIKRKNDNISK